MNIQPNKRMLKHNRDLPKLTCGTTNATLMKAESQEVVHWQPTSAVKQKAPALTNGGLVHARPDTRLFPPGYRPRGAAFNTTETRQH